MEVIIEKLSSYNLLNNLIPGIVFCYLSDFILHFSLVKGYEFPDVVVYYFIGIVISRIGSLVVEPILLGMKFVVHAPYSEYVTASASDKMIRKILEVNNLYRSFISLFFLIFSIKGFMLLIYQFNFSQEYFYVGIIIFLIILFLASYRKNTKYIYNRVKKYMDEN